MQVQELIKQLKTIKGQKKQIRVASDEEWNSIFDKFMIQENGDNGEFVIFGLSGTEQEQIY